VSDGVRAIVVGTAGHIDHGKTTLLRALTGIDADRLPEERRRGMTIDVGYAHLALSDRSVIDFVDVPGHDRLVGNMLVGAGEIDAALLVVAADDGPNAQTLEHLELLDALGISDGLAVVTKADLATEERRRLLPRELASLLAPTSLAGVPVLVTSAMAGEGLDTVRDALAALAARTSARNSGGSGRPRLAIDRVFGVRGRGIVVTGSLRGGPLHTGDALRLEPGGRPIRVRELQARGATVKTSDTGRTAVLVGGVDAADLRRGKVLTSDPRVVASSRVLVALRPPADIGHGSHARFGATGSVARRAVPSDRARVRLHLGTDQVDALVIRGPREAIDLPDGSSLTILRLSGAIAAAPGDRFALRWPSPPATAAGGVVLDPSPPRGISRRRLTPERAATLVAAVMDDLPGGAVDAAWLDIHGALSDGTAWRLASDVAQALETRARQLVATHHAAEPDSPGLAMPVLRAELARAARRAVTLDRRAAGGVAGMVVDGLVVSGALAREGDRVRDPDRAAGLPPAARAAMDRLEAALSVAAPPPLAETARGVGCPPDGVRALESAGRIVRLEDDLAWSASTHRELVRQAVAMAATGPLSPAAFRDATGTSRRYVLVILEDLDRRGILQRTDAGHVLSPRMLERLRARAAAPSASSAPSNPSAPSRPAEKSPDDTGGDEA
jgi:selenocysteine-specific elongation factor